MLRFSSRSAHASGLRGSGNNPIYWIAFRRKLAREPSLLLRYSLMVISPAISKPNVASHQFSLRETLLAVGVCAVALSIWRLPGGDWFDIPCSMLSAYFSISLAGHAVAVWQA